jgi:hypothetical protein
MKTFITIHDIRYMPPGLANRGAGGQMKRVVYHIGGQNHHRRIAKDYVFTTESPKFSREI